MLDENQAAAVARRLADDLNARIAAWGAEGVGEDEIRDRTEFTGRMLTAAAVQEAEAEGRA